MTTKKISIILLMCLTAVLLCSNTYSIPLEEGSGFGLGCGSILPFENNCPAVYSTYIQFDTFSGLVPPSNNTANNFSSGGSDGTLFIQQKYRVANYNLKFTHETPVNYCYTLYVNYLNTSNEKTEQFWHLAVKKNLYFSTSNYTTPVEVPFTVDSDTGIVILGLVSCNYTFAIKTRLLLNGESTIEYPSPNTAVLQPMSAGGEYVIPLVNRWRYQKTEVFDTSFNTLAEAENTSGFYFKKIKLDCSAPTNELTYNIVVNYNKTNSAHQTAYGFYTNVTSLQPLNFTAISPTNNTNITIPVGGVGNFSVLPNLPERVEAIVLYVNGSEKIINPATNGSFNYVFNYPGQYVVEVQAEDNDCKIYPTAKWYVNVGRTVEITGTVYGNTGGVISPLSGVTVILNSTNIFKTNITDSYGSFWFSNLPAGNYTLTFSKSGYSTLTKTVSCPYSANPGVAITQYSYEVTLNRSRNNCSAVFNVYDRNTFAPITNYTLDLYLSNEKVFSIANGTTLLSLFSITGKTSGSIINVSNLNPEYAYRFMITKSGYNYGEGVVSCSIEEDENVSYPLSKVGNICSVNFSDTAPQGVNYNLLTDTVEIGTIIYTSAHPFKVCSSYGLSNNTYDNVACRDGVSGSNVLVDILTNLIANKTYYFKYYAVSSYCPALFAETSGYFTTTGGSAPTTTTATTTTTKITIRTTTTTTTTYVYSTTTSIPPIVYGNATKIEYNCSNITQLIKNGDIFHASICPYVLFFGVSIFYGIAFFIVVILTYRVTKSYAVAGIISLIYTSVFINVLPQPTINYLSVGVGIGFGLLLYDLFKGM